MINMKKITLLLYGFLIGMSVMSCDKQVEVKPNIVFILADDLGYADLSSYGSEFINTPFLDEMAVNGAKLTSYYSSQAVCSASRAAILTGTYSNRIGINGAFGPKSKRGINENELLISEMLKENGYKTGIFGKWHLGDADKFKPTRHGFDEFFGILFSNDMWPFHPEFPNAFPDDLLLYRNEKPIETLIDQSDLTKRITDESIRFINENKDNPFEDGMSIKVKITGKRHMDLKGLSGGEKTLTALAFIFAVQEHNPATFYILDEIDAALDKHNSDRLAKLIGSYSDRAQYIVISHNDAVISEADQLYGVSMSDGVSKVTSLKI